MRVADRRHRFEERNWVSYALLGLLSHARRLQAFVDRELVGGNARGDTHVAPDTANPRELLAVLGAVSVARQVEAVLTAWVDEARAVQGRDTARSAPTPPSTRGLMR